MKRICSIFLVFSLILGISACSSDGTKEATRVFNTSQNYRFSYQPIKWAFSFTFLVKFLDFLYRIFSYVMV